MNFKDKKVLLICGAGQYGLAAKDIAETIGAFSKIIFLDNKSELAVGRFDEIDAIEYDVAFIAVGDPNVRRDMFGKIKKHATLIHPQAIVMPSAKIGEGSIIEAGAVISSNVEIGRGTIVMANAVVGHDAKVGDFCQLKYNCSICERSLVRDQAKIDCNEVYRNVP